MFDRRFLIRLSLWLGLGCSAAILSLACHRLFDGELTGVQCQKEDEGAEGPPVCPPGDSCVDGACIEAPPTVEERAPLGGLCETDDDCAEGFCLDPAKLALPPFSAPGTMEPFCSTSCCSSDECRSNDHDMVCRPGPEAAGRVCVPSSQPIQGKGRGGAMCSDDNDCRSGLCADDRCIDVCCTTVSCDQGNECVVQAWPGGEGGAGGSGNGDALPPVWQCAPSPDPGMLEPGAPCMDHNQCSTGQCLTLADNVRVCAESCCSRHDCGTTAGNPNMAQALTCSPTALGGDGGGNPTSFNACSQTQPENASKTLNEDCDDDGECLSGLCEEIDDNGTMKCTAICCRDDDCGDLDALACRPLKNSTGWALRCVPR